MVETTASHAPWSVRSRAAGGNGATRRLPREACGPLGEWQRVRFSLPTLRSLGWPNRLRRLLVGYQRAVTSTWLFWTPAVLSSACTSFSEQRKGQVCITIRGGQSKATRLRGRSLPAGRALTAGRGTSRHRRHRAVGIPSWVSSTGKLESVGG